MSEQKTPSFIATFLVNEYPSDSRYDLRNAIERAIQAERDVTIAAQNNIEKLNHKIAELEAECSAMRNVLTQISFDFDPEKSLGPLCGPESLALILKALKTNAGTKLLERMKLLEDVAEASREVCRAWHSELAKPDSITGVLHKALAALDKVDGK